MPRFKPRSYKSLSDSGFDTDDELTAIETDITLDAQDAGAVTLPIGTIIRIETEYMTISGNDAANPTVLTVVRGTHGSIATTHLTNQDVLKIVKGSCVLYLEGQQDPQSSTIRDLSGYNNHGTIIGATWSRLPSGLWVNSFDGTNDYISCGAVVFDWNSDFTYIGWVSLLTGVGAQGGIFNNRSAASWIAFGWESTSIAVEISAAAYSYAGIDERDNGYAMYSITSTSHIVQIQRNGIAVGTPINATALNLGASGALLRIGAWAGASSCWKDGMGSHRLFNCALSVTEIAGIYQSERHLFNA
jgi:hypothetical protein